MNAADQRRLTPLLGGTAVLLGALWLVLLTGAGSAARWDPPRPATPLPPPHNHASLPQPMPLQPFAQVWQKPLFSPDRKPVAHAARDGSNIGDLELTGIILTPSLRMALLHDRNGDKQVRLREGEALPDGSLTLSQVGPRSATFASASGRTELKLPAGAPIDHVAPDAATPPSSSAAHIAPAASRGQPAHRAPPDKPAPLPAGTPHSIRLGQAPATGASTQSPPRNPARESRLHLLKASIQKRRATQAAKAHEGVR